MIPFSLLLLLDPSDDSDCSTSHGHSRRKPGLQLVAKAADPQAARSARRQQRYQGRLYWVVKDPVGLQYYRFEEEEYAILQMLDGQSSLDEIAQRFERDFPPQTIRTEELQQFIGMLHRSGLVITDAAGPGPAARRSAAANGNARSGWRR